MGAPLTERRFKAWAENKGYNLKRMPHGQQYRLRQEYNSMDGLPFAMHVQPTSAIPHRDWHAHKLYYKLALHVAFVLEGHIDDAENIAMGVFSDYCSANGYVNVFRLG